MLRTAKVSQNVIEQFSVFDTDGYTKLSGQAGSCVATLWKDGIESAVSVAIAEIGSTGEYTASFTPDAIGVWVLQVKDSQNRIWGATVEVRTNDIDSLDIDTELIKAILANRLRIDTSLNTMTIYEDDGVTPLVVWDLKDANGNPASADVYERDPQ